MRKRFLFLVPSLFAGVLFLSILNFSVFQNPQVCFEEDCFFVELAETDKEKARGLMLREHLDEDKGMLFIYDEEGRHNFWMKNTLIPLDIIWIDSSFEVVYIERNAQPCSDFYCDPINPGSDAQYVFEINGGKAVEIGLGIGDKLEFKI